MNRSSSTPTSTPRADTSIESLATLRPIRARIDPESTVTAGNASGQNDGAAVAIVTTAEKAAQLGLRPLARLASWAVAGVPPRTMGIGPVPATEKALGRLGLTLADMDVIELNEAFAAQTLAVTRSWGLEPDDTRLNPNGSGISLGHPVGATGGRILATLLRELDRRGGALRPRDDVHRRRPGPGRGVREGGVAAGVSFGLPGQPKGHTGRVSGGRARRRVPSSRARSAR